MVREGRYGTANRFRYDGSVRYRYVLRIHPGAEDTRGVPGIAIRGGDNARHRAQRPQQARGGLRKCRVHVVVDVRPSGENPQKGGRQTRHAAAIQRQARNPEGLQYHPLRQGLRHTVTSGNSESNTSGSCKCSSSFGGKPAQLHLHIFASLSCYRASKSRGVQIVPGGIRRNKLHIGG